jgi:hypothetical protein
MPIRLAIYGSIPLSSNSGALDGVRFDEEMGEENQQKRAEEPACEHRSVFITCHSRWSWAGRMGGGLVESKRRSPKQRPIGFGVGLFDDLPDYGARPSYLSSNEDRQLLDERPSSHRPLVRSPSNSTSTPLL